MDNHNDTLIPTQHSHSYLTRITFINRAIILPVIFTFSTFYAIAFYLLAYYKGHTPIYHLNPYIKLLYIILTINTISFLIFYVFFLLVRITFTFKFGKLVIIKEGIFRTVTLEFDLSHLSLHYVRTHDISHRAMLKLVVREGDLFYLVLSYPNKTLQSHDFFNLFYRLQTHLALALGIVTKQRRPLKIVEIVSRQEKVWFWPFLDQWKWGSREDVWSEFESSESHVRHVGQDQMGSKEKRQESYQHLKSEYNLLRLDAPLVEMDVHCPPFLDQFDMIIGHQDITQMGPGSQLNQSNHSLIFFELENSLSLMAEQDNNIQIPMIKRESRVEKDKSRKQIISFSISHKVISVDHIQLLRHDGLFQHFSLHKICSQSHPI